MIIPILGLSIWGVFKILLIIVMALYIIFALVVIRQVQLMTDTLEIGFELPLRIISYVHLLFAIAVLIFTVLIL